MKCRTFVRRAKKKLNCCAMVIAYVRAVKVDGDKIQTTLFCGRFKLEGHVSGVSVSLFCQLLMAQEMDEKRNARSLI